MKQKSEPDLPNEWEDINNKQAQDALQRGMWVRIDNDRYGSPCEGLYIRVIWVLGRRVVACFDENFVQLPDPILVKHLSRIILCYPNDTHGFWQVAAGTDI